MELRDHGEPHLWSRSAPRDSLIPRFESAPILEPILLSPVGPECPALRIPQLFPQASWFVRAARTPGRTRKAVPVGFASWFTRMGAPRWFESGPTKNKKKELLSQFFPLLLFVTSKQPSRFAS
jgi:hypothetical protein